MQETLIAAAGERRHPQARAVPRLRGDGAVSMAAGFVAAILILLAPALWNGFPLLQYDSGGYLARWYEGTLEESRSTVYGLFLDLLARPDFWPAILVQTALTVWIIGLVLRVHGVRARPVVLVPLTLLLSVLTTLPWLTDVLLTDIFAGLSLFSLYLLVLRPDELRRWERVALLVLVGFAAASHSGTMAMLLALLTCGVTPAVCGAQRVRLSALGRAALGPALGAAMLLGANYAVAKELVWTPGGIALSFGRMLQDGIVTRYLDDHCPDPRLKLCPFRRDLPDDADTFFWGSSVFEQLGRFQGLQQEMQTIVLQSLLAYPWMQIKAAAAAVGKQLVRVQTGDGVLTSIWHTYGMIENFVPSALPAMKAARQQQGQLDFTAINRLHVPVAFVSMLLLPGMIALGLWRRRYADLALLAATTTLAILVNAFIFGALSGPHDRYGARMAWVAPFVVLLVPLRRLASRDDRR
jgi:hypothetical protein